MESGHRRLVRHLAIAVALKLVAITLLWSAFVQDARVEVGTAEAAAHLGAPTSPPLGAPQ